MRSFWKRAGGWIALLALVVCLPLWLRGRGAPSPAAGLPRLVVLSPHNEAVRAEFGRAFAEWHRRNYGAEVALDWRSPGGTSEIVRYLTGGYTAAFRHEWEAAGNPWSAAVQAALLKPEGKNQKTGETADGAAAAARRAFLESRSGVGVDVFFGGGQYDHQRLAEMGILVPCGLRARHPELFDGADPVIPRALGGELWYDPQDRYYGVCLATFGLCYNPRRWAEVMPPGTPPPIVRRIVGTFPSLGESGTTLAPNWRWSAACPSMNSRPSSKRRSRIRAPSVSATTRSASTTKSRASCSGAT